MFAITINCIWYFAAGAHVVLVKAEKNRFAVDFLLNLFYIMKVY